MEANAYLIQSLSPNEQETFFIAIELNITLINAAGFVPIHFIRKNDIAGFLKKSGDHKYWAMKMLYIQ